MKGIAVIYTVIYFVILTSFFGIMIGRLRGDRQIMATKYIQATNELAFANTIIEKANSTNIVYCVGWKIADYDRVTNELACSYQTQQKMSAEIAHLEWVIERLHKDSTGEGL